MHITIEPGVRLFVDVEGPGLVPDGAGWREKPTLIVLHGGPGFDHSSFKPLFSQLADVAQIVYYDHRGHGRSSPRPLTECTLDVLADAPQGDDGWRLMKSRADTILQGYSAQDMAVWDRAGTPLIVARQNVAVFI